MEADMEYPNAKPLVAWNDSILKETMPFIDPDKDLAQSMVETLLKEGTGLAITASMIGERSQALAIASDPMLVMFKPRIVDTSEETHYVEDANMCVPNLVVKVKRPQVVRVRYTQINGEVKTEVFEGLTAGFICSMIDLLNGTRFTELATSYHLERGKKLRAKLERKRR